MLQAYTDYIFQVIPIYEYNGVQYYGQPSNETDVIYTGILITYTVSD